MKSNIAILALILIPGIVLAIAPKKRDFEPIQPKRAIQAMVKDKKAIYRAELLYYGPHGKIELPSNGSEPEATLFPRISFK
jgi:hypothetical protein